MQAERLRVPGVCCRCPIVSPVCVLNWRRVEDEGDFTSIYLGSATPMDERVVTAELWRLGLHQKLHDPIW